MAALPLEYRDLDPVFVDQFIMYGLVGFIPSTISSWLSHKFADEPRPAVPA